MQDSKDKSQEMMYKCPNCGKTIRKGSMTAWIFSGSSGCKCSEQEISNALSDQVQVKSASSIKLKQQDESHPSEKDSLNVLKTLEGDTVAKRYRLQKLIGIGGMGAVYKAKESSVDKTYAIKMLHSELVNDNAAVRRFEREAKAASALTHPNLVAVYDYGLDKNKPFIVMDFLEGDGLDTLIKNKTFLDVDQAIELFIQIADAIAYAHEKRVIHRDLKPSNIIVISSEGGVDFVKIVDFGIAKILPEGEKITQELTQSGEIFGSPFYMSPEQCLGLSITTASDIYSLGCVMFETLTGKPPLAGNNPIQTILLHINELPEDLAKDYSQLGISRDLAYIVGRCLEKNPDDRYSSVKELKDDLLKLRDGEKIKKIQPKREPIETRTRAVKLFTRKSNLYRFSLIVLSIFLGLATVAAGVFYVGSSTNPGGNFEKQWYSLDEKGQEHFNRGEYLDAKNAFESALATAKDAKNNKFIIASLNELLDLARAREDENEEEFDLERIRTNETVKTRETKTLFDELDEAVNSKNNNQDDLKDLVNRANDSIGSLIEAGRIKVATKLLDKVEIVTKEKLPAKSLEAIRTIHNLGYLEHGKGNYEVALKHYETALKLEKGILPAKDTNRALTLLMMSRLNLQSASLNPSQTESNLKEALAIYRSNNRRKEMGWTRYHLAALAYRMNKNDQALKELDVAISIFKNLSESQAANRYLAACYQLKGSISKNIDSLKKALAIAQKETNKDYPVLVKTLISYANEIESVNPQLAKSLLNRALALTKRLAGINSQTQAIDIELKIAKLDRASSDIESAIKHAEQAEELSKKLTSGNTIRLFEIQYLLGTYYDDSGNKEKAIEYLKSAKDKTTALQRLASTTEAKDLENRLKRLTK